MINLQYDDIILDINDSAVEIHGLSAIWIYHAPYRGDDGLPFLKDIGRVIQAISVYVGKKSFQYPLHYLGI